MSETIVAVDLGGTRLRVALFDRQFQLLDRHAEPARPEEGPDSVIERMVAAIRRLGEGVGWDSVDAVGISAPGPLDPKQGVILWAPNLPGWREVPLVARLQEALDRPVVLANDANLAALAEQRRGAGRGQADVVYITVSTGVGGGLISDGRLVLGQRGLGGEVGHMTLEAQGPRCNCGNIGCLEALASGTAIARQARELIEAGARSAIADLAQGDLEQITARVVHQAADQGDAVAIDLFRKAGMYLGVGIVNLMYLVNPGVVIVGGGVAKAGDLLFLPMRATVQQRIDPVYWRDCPIVAAQLADDVSLIGAAIRARESSD
jgi:glucokinase